MYRFVTYDGDDGKRRCEFFFDEAGLWKWLQDWRGANGSWPKNLCVFKAECVFDAS